MGQTNKNKSVFLGCHRFKHPNINQIHGNLLFYKEEPMFYIENLDIIHNTTNEKIIDNLSFLVQENQKLALIGEEGTGKTSLIKALNQEDLGFANAVYTNISTPAIINYVPQIVTIKGSVSDYLMNDMVDYGRLYELMDGFNISEDLLQRKEGPTLSGGEATKIALVKAFLYEADLIILDEPTNNLDIKSIQYLEKLCQTTNIPIIFASHDIRFIETISTMVLHFESLRKRTKNRQTLYSMNYIDFKSLRENTIVNETMKYESEMKSLKIAEKRYERVHDNVAHALNTVTRQNPQAARNLKDKMSQVKNIESRIKKRRDTLIEPKEFETPINLILNSESVPSSKTLVDLNLEILAIHGKTLSKNIHFKLIGPKKVAIIGNNGVGKTTLIKEIMKHTKVPFAYMPQSYATIMDVNKSALELLCDIRVKQDKSKTMTLLGSLSFTFDEMNLPFDNLSGGQKAKVFFTQLALNKTQLLIMDEPTRNISPLSMEVLNEQIRSYKGALIVITHDRNLLDTLIDEVYELTPDGLFKKDLDVVSYRFGQ